MMVMMILIMRSIPPADTAEVVLPPPLSFCRQRAPLKSPIIQTPTQHVSISGAIEVQLGVLWCQINPPTRIPTFEIFPSWQIYCHWCNCQWQFLLTIKKCIFMCVGKLFLLDSELVFCVFIIWGVWHDRRLVWCFHNESVAFKCGPVTWDELIDMDQIPTKLHWHFNRLIPTAK